MKILIGTDFSPAAQMAADAAAALASATDGLITLVHVHHALTLPELPDFAAQAAENASKSLGTEAERIRKSGVEVGIDFVKGSPGRGLLDAAARHEADLLVVGSDPARKAADRWLMGDVAEYVAEHAHVPTLIVRNARPIIDWALKLEPLKILIGENLRESSDHPLLWVKGLSDIAPFRTTVAYVMWPYEESLRYGYTLPLSYLDIPPEVVSMTERDLQERVGRLMGNLPVDAVVKASWGTADGPLAQLAKERRIELLVVGSRQHRRLSRFLEHSVSRAVIRDTAVNLAIVPNRPAPGSLTPVRRFERVLIPTDFSAAGNHAVPFGYSMVPPGGVVCLAHVCSRGHSGDPETEARLRSLIPPESQNFGIRTEVMVTEDDDPWSGIVHLANRLGSDAVCMANHARSGIGETFLKSTTREVLRQIRVPVLIVHPATKD